MHRKLEAGQDLAALQPTTLPPTAHTRALRPQSNAKRVGDSQFGDCYRKEYPQIVRLAMALVGRRDVAEEIAQESFVALYRRWDSVCRYDSPAGWLRRITTNRCVSTLRRRAVEARVLITLGTRLRAEVDGPEISEFWSLIRSLPPRQAQVVALTFVDDKSAAEAASILGCSEETVRTHLRRALVKLEELTRTSQA